MRKYVLALAALALIAVPTTTAAQIGIGGRAGTLGLGAEIGLELSESIVLRGGMGFVPLELNQSFSEMNLTATFPSIISAGIDLFPGGGSFRISGGVLFRPDDIELDGIPIGPVDIGGTTYTVEQVGSIVGTIGSSSEIAPFVTIGWGKHTSSGFGLFLDIGAAYLGDPEVDAQATGTFAEDDAFNDHLDAEIAEFEDDLGSYLQFYPILSIGIRIGIS
ncbi:MAG: hypothetical protein JRI25_24800 [Deltaproteobacteria bacterium]|nr:hypothetical protein [Deltaproteobacteria bacterium]